MPGQCFSTDGSNPEAVSQLEAEPLKELPWGSLRGDLQFRSFKWLQETNTQNLEVQELDLGPAAAVRSARVNITHASHSSRRETLMNPVRIGSWRDAGTF